MKVIIDACSVILLGKITILETFLSNMNTLITRGVYEEVIAGKEKKLFDALLLERLVNENKIKISDDFDKNIFVKLSEDFGLGKGEAETIGYAIKNKQTIIITDNKQGRKTAKIYGLSLSGSIEVIVSLYKSNKIDKNKALNSILNLKKFGWFNDDIINKAMEDIK